MYHAPEEPAENVCAVNDLVIVIPILIFYIWILYHGLQLLSYYIHTYTHYYTELVLGCEFKCIQNLSTFLNLSISISSVYTLSQLPGVMYVTVHITYSTMSTEV